MHAVGLKVNNNKLIQSIKITEQLLSISVTDAVPSKLQTIEFSPQNTPNISSLLMWNLRLRDNVSSQRYKILVI